jgi:ubiquinone/menaquinone biosynthesis C-methylase UbiE
VSQRARFLASEGDAYFARNRGTESAADPVLEVLGELALSPKRVLEVGAGEGLRLAALRRHLPAAQLVALDPSQDALRASLRRCIPGARATAERLPFRDGEFELVILGFCLYLVDREDLFAVAAEVDRVLAATAHVAIFDFLPQTPQRRAYAHARGLYSYKMDYTQMFLWNPAYRCVTRRTFTHPGGDPRRAEDRLAVSVLARDAASAWPEER